MGAFVRRDDISATLDEVYAMFPVLAREAAPAGRRAVGRPAPDGGDRPRADEQAEAADARRAHRPGCRRAYATRSSSASCAINKAGVGILMVEQNARQALAFAHTRLRAGHGQNRFTGTGAELIADPEVAEASSAGAGMRIGDCHASRSAIPARAREPPCRSRDCGEGRDPRTSSPGYACEPLSAALRATDIC